jgi:hypothetical protein
LPERGDWDPFGVDGSLPQGAWDKSVASAANCDIKIELIENYGAGPAGRATILQGTHGSHLIRGTDGTRFRIRINSRFDMAARFATLAHGLGHIYCGHLGGDRKDRWADRSGHSQMARANSKPKPCRGSCADAWASSRALPSTRPVTSRRAISTASARSPPDRGVAAGRMRKDAP